MIFLPYLQNMGSENNNTGRDFPPLLVKYGVGKKRNTDHDFSPLLVKYGVGK